MKGVLWYVALAFGLAWAAIFGAHAAGISLDNPLAQLPMAFAPAVAAIVVRRFVTREGFADAALRPRFRAALPYYLLAWTGPIAVLAVATGWAVALEGVRLAGLGTVGLLALAALVVPPIFWGEEFGWRSYLQQRLGKNPLVAVLATGVIWAVWHWPLAFTGYQEYDDVVVGLGVWGLHTVLLAIVLGWLFLRSGSVWVTSLAHGTSNLVCGVGGEILLIENGGLSPVMLDVLLIVPTAILAAVIVATGGLRRPAARTDLVPA